MAESVGKRPAILVYLVELLLGHAKLIGHAVERISLRLSRVLKALLTAIATAISVLVLMVLDSSC